MDTNLPVIVENGFDADEINNDNDFVYGAATGAVATVAVAATAYGVYKLISWFMNDDKAEEATANSGCDTKMRRVAVKKSGVEKENTAAK